MILRVIKIGNSKGLRLSKAILEQYRIDKEVDVQSTADGLLIKPRRTKARSNWAVKFKEMAAHGDDKLLLPENLDLDSKDWEW